MALPWWFPWLEARLICVDNTFSSDVLFLCANTKMQTRTKKELYDLARLHGVPNRSKMNKAALVKALRGVTDETASEISFEPGLFYDGKAGLVALPRGVVVKHLPKLVAWYRRHARAIAGHAVKVRGDRGKIFMRWTGSRQLRDLLADPDEDANDPLRVEGRDCLVMPRTKVEIVDDQ